MRTFKLAAIAAVAITAAAAGSQVRGDAYGYSYTPTYSSYPVGNSNCPSGQCGTSAAVPSYSYAPSYSYSSYYPGTAIPAVATYPSSSCPNCPNGSCSSCPNGPAALAATVLVVPAGQTAAARMDAAARARRSLPIGELFGQLSERPMHARPQP